MNTSFEKKVHLISPKNGAGLISQKIGRNSICTCGSGKKAKQCCGNETIYHTIELLRWKGSDVVTGFETND